MKSDIDADGAAIQTLTSDDFEERVTRGRGPIAVEFMSYGCSHCRTLEPMVRRAAERLRSKVGVFRVNVAVDELLASRYAVRGTPTIVLFFDGEEVGRVEGPQPRDAAVMEALTQSFALAA